mgnify:CR=1 FL=1
MGNGALWSLRGRPGSFHVLIYAPREDKIKRVRALGKSEEEATGMVDTIDQERAAFSAGYVLRLVKADGRQRPECAYRTAPIPSGATVGVVFDQSSTPYQP